ncbi:DNA (cytosine-5-)-methyltransferase [Pseudacidovorax intermedius]|uniref:DNA (cytosine-5-)-methyltransferase n=1 Tax=Pseudacidovorax intermedius TaxID=433924 RepID=UPI0005C2A20F|nr:DNA cytosine methyltransferase [Pseudacidovorax intermedius]
MRFLSVCSGIEAASVAWGPLGWKPVAFSEIEPFPCAVLAHHYPDTPNWGDMTKFKDWPDAAVDLLCGGTPCQSFSVAGLRKGLDDPRGNLMLTFGAIAAKYRPRWLVWENVPGVLSSNGGRDFGAFLWMLGQLGYGFAYRVLDAQHFGVPQRRRRVFVVGCLGDWRRAAAVLFERHSLSGHPAPRREARQGVARCLTRGSGGGHRYDGESETFVTHTLRAAGFDASEDGTGRGTPLVPVPIGVDGFNGLLTGEVAATMGTRGSSETASGPTVMQAIAFDCKSSGQNGFGVGVELAGTQRAMGHANSHRNGGGHQAVAYAIGSHAGVADGEQSNRSHASGGPVGGNVSEELSYSLRAGRTQSVGTAMQVRRLTPMECERLQGFPDGYTAITVRGKPAADGPRYKALGNSWAIPCVRWIGERINAVEALIVQEAA